MAQPDAQTPHIAPRINATRPENLNSSSKRTSKAQLLQQYAQLLPLAPAKQSYLQSPLSALRIAPGLRSPEIEAVWDDLTQSVWVQDEASMMRLWKQGFFGKGFLSRSEPSWRRRVQNRRAEVEGREKRAFLSSDLALLSLIVYGLRIGLTSEEITALRRIERKGTKLAKKLERDQERFLAASAAASSIGSAPGTPSTSSSPLPSADTDELESRLEKIAEEKAESAGPSAADKGKAKAEDQDADEDVEKEEPPEEWQLGAEHSQLQPEEAFFLVFGIGCLALNVPSDDTSPTAPKRLSILETFRLFLLTSCPSLSPSLTLAPESDPRLNRFDSPFFLSYAAYHHYRSMGWVVRSGVKFCVDWVLYGQGGPVGGHAE